MPDLSVAEYDQAEQSAIATTSNRAIEAFQPFTFLKIGYPDRVRQEAELFKYIDVMHENEFEGHISEQLGGISEPEFELVRRLTSLVCDFSEANFGKKSIPRATMLGALNVFRHIQYIFGEARPPVFEIGPGSGYLGAMLILEGYPYLATEVSQAFYLYQSHLWNYISGGKLLELAHPNHSVEEFAMPPPGGGVHIPWWELVRLRPELIPDFDVVTCNRVLCEMHGQSLNFIMKITKAAMRGHDTPKAFVFNGWGSAIGTPAHSVTQAFYGAGFGLVHYDPQITVMAPQDMECGKSCLSLPDTRLKRLLGIRLRNVFRYLTGLPPLRRDVLYGPHQYTSASNPLSSAIMSGREAGEGTRTVGVDRLNRFYDELVGEEDHLTPDERFQTWPGNN